MEALLISVNRETNPYPVAPLGLAYLSSSLKKAGHDVGIVDLCFSGDEEKILRESIERKKPGVICISIRNIDNLTYPKSVFYLPYIKKIVDFIKSVTSSPVIAGGSGFSLFPEETLRYLDIGYGIIGEGEKAIVSFAEHISGRCGLGDVPNLCYIDGGSFRMNTMIREEGFRDSGTPDRELIDNSGYLEYGGMANIQSKRGCPFSCSYCTYPYIDGKRLRLRNPVDIVSEIEDAKKKFGINYIFFVDDIFNFPADHALGICEEIIRRNVDISWACFAVPGGMTKELAGMMKKAGCRGIEFGTDSGSEKMLSNLNKSFSLPDVEKAADICRQAELPAAHYVIIGGPGEDRKTLNETFSFFDSIRPDTIIALTGIRVYPNTMLRRTALDEGVISEDTDLLSPRFYISPALGEDYMLSSVREHALSRQNWIVPGLDIRCSTEMMTMLRRLGKRGPLWDLLAGRN